MFGLGTKPFREGEYYYGTDLIYTIVYYSMLFPTVGWPMTSALAANFAYLYTLPLYIFFFSLYYNVVIQSTLLQHYDICSCYILKKLIYIAIVSFFSCQLSSYTKYIKLNVYLFCDIRLVFNTKCICFMRLYIL